MACPIISVELAMAITNYHDSYINMADPRIGSKSCGYLGEHP